LCADLWDLAVKENTETCWTSYKQFTRKLDKALAKYYASVENKIIASKVPSKLYNYINSRLKARNKLPALVVDESHLAISDKDKAELLAEKFQLAFSNHCEQSMGDLTPLCPAMEQTVWFHREEIYEVLSAWPTSPSITPDFIPFKFIKMVLNHLLYPLEHLFNLSYLRAEVPERWKHSLVTPAFDRVPIPLLISKLRYVGLHPRAINWISCFLQNRTYQVRIGDALSNIFFRLAVVFRKWRLIFHLLFLYTVVTTL
ncbi:hypothetical protein COOONC_19809, partial [Cooperia oncophora]